LDVPAKRVAKPRTQPRVISKPKSNTKPKSCKGTSVKGGPVALRGETFKEGATPKYKVLTPTETWSIEQKLDISHLAKTLLSPESKKLQQKGYTFAEVLTPQNNYAPKTDYGKLSTQVIDIPGKWGDKILFVLRK
jgi:hypothetical protein